MTTITLPPDIDERLTAEARRRGTTPERLALDTLRTSFVPNGDKASAPTVSSAGANEESDPLISHIGEFRTPVDDWAARHDDYLGQDLLKEMRGETTTRGSDG